MSTTRRHGPWTVSEIGANGEKSEHYIFIQPDVAVIERRVAGLDGDDMPNAHLISAAPDLLTALELVLSVADRATFEFDLARAAIKKARGEQ